MNEKSSGSRSRKQRLTAGGTRCADHVTPLYPQKLALTSPTGGGHSVGIVRVRTKATEFVFCSLLHRNAKLRTSKDCTLLFHLTQPHIQHYNLSVDITTVKSEHLRSTVQGNSKKDVSTLKLAFTVGSMESNFLGVLQALDAKSQDTRRFHTAFLPKAFLPYI